MGMDLYGNNPKENKKLSEYPVYGKYRDMNFKVKWEELKEKELESKYFDEMGQYEEENPGAYFRNNVWWWRPLWDFCHAVSDVIDDELHDKGHMNDGAGLDSQDSVRLAVDLETAVHNGAAKEWERRFNTKREKDEAIAYNTYPFSEENVLEFAKFLSECGGFRIC
tara:strand:- start:1201 stop:1698 length:498 start_codon:yes stop_codon:yes gene_type:complete